MRTSQIPLSRYELLSLSSLRAAYPQVFNRVINGLFLAKMEEYVRRAVVFRLAIMGETRSGKSEVAQTIAKTYSAMFDKAFADGAFKDVKVDIPIHPVKLDTAHICMSQGEYLYKLKDDYSRGALSFGQCWIIDEHKSELRGIGSLAEYNELKDMNNIVAKYMQSEIWITPVKFLSYNTVFGLYVFKKDVKNRVNWCLAYKLMMTPDGGVNYQFLGWLKVPLHSDEALRREYNQIKNKNIDKVIEGRGDERMMEREAAAKRLARDPLFRKWKTKTFALTKEQQMVILERYIRKGEMLSFTEAEKWRVLEEARLIVIEEKEANGE